MTDTTGQECCARLNVEEACLCPVGGVTEVLSKRWAVPLVATLGSFGRLRFKEIQAKLPRISPSILATRLRELERAGVVKRKTFAEVPPKVEYELTPSGKELRTLLLPLVNWVQEIEARR